jgi:hypothetical protein
MFVIREALSLKSLQRKPGCFSDFFPASFFIEKEAPLHAHSASFPRRQQS